MIFATSSYAAMIGTGALAAAGPLATAAIIAAPLAGGLAGLLISAAVTASAGPVRAGAAAAAGYIAENWWDITKRVGKAAGKAVKKHALKVVATVWDIGVVTYRSKAATILKLLSNQWILLLLAAAALVAYVGTKRGWWTWEDLAREAGWALLCLLFGQWLEGNLPVKKIGEKVNSVFKIFG